MLRRCFVLIPLSGTLLSAPGVYSTKVAVVGGGIGGSVAALELLKRYPGVKVDLFERRADILQGPPWCHLHAGGMLYPEISWEESSELLDHSIAFAQEFSEALLIRPTVVACRKSSRWEPEGLVAKCEYVQSQVDRRPAAMDLSGYCAVYTEEDVAAFKKTGSFLPRSAFHDPYVKTFLGLVKTDQIKLPFVSVKEFGIDDNVARDKVRSLLAGYSNLKLHLNVAMREAAQATSDYDYVIDASAQGALRTADRTNSFYELKASYLVSSERPLPHLLPEIAILGERGTANGLVQVSPTGLPGLLQIHAMTPTCTLFEGGLQKGLDLFPERLKSYIANDRIDPSDVEARTEQAIAEVSRVLDICSKSANRSRWGVQRILGRSADRRANDVVFRNERLAEIAIVKGISAVATARKIADVFGKRLAQERKS